MKSVRFSHLHLPVSDLARSTQFYRDGLGFSVTFSIEGNMAAFGNGLVLDQARGDTLRLLSLQSRIQEPPEPQIPAATVAFAVDDVDAFFQTLGEKHVQLGDPPCDQPWGERNFYLRDPDGYVIEFGHPVRSR